MNNQSFELFKLILEINKALAENDTISESTIESILNRNDDIYKIIIKNESSSSPSLSQPLRIVKKEDINSSDPSSIYNILLQNYQPNRKIPIIKIIRAITCLGLKETKDLIESTNPIISNLTTDQTLEFIYQFDTEHCNYIIFT